MSGAGEAVLGVILVGGSGLLLAGTVARARGAWRGAPPVMRGGKIRGSALRSGKRVPGFPRRGFPAGGGFLEHRRQVALLWHKAWTADWLEEQREERKARRAAAEAQGRNAAPDAAPKPGTGAQPASPSSPPEPPGAARAPAPAAGRPRRKTVPGILLWRKDRVPVRSGDSPPPDAAGDSRASGTSAPQPGRPTGATAPEPSPASDRPPASGAGQRPSPSQPGGTHMSTAAGGAVEQAIEGVHGIHASAAAGGIHAKHAAVKACGEVFIRIAAMVAMMSRALAEPGANYGPEITEPLAKAAQMSQAAALACGESDAALSSLKNMTVGDLAHSPRQAPHNSELTETGTR